MSYVWYEKALHYVGNVARKGDAVVPYASMALNTVSVLAPEYGVAAMQTDDSLGVVFNRLTRSIIYSKDSE